MIQSEALVSFELLTILVGLYQASQAPFVSPVEEKEHAVNSLQ